MERGTILELMEVRKGLEVQAASWRPSGGMSTISRRMGRLCAPCAKTCTTCLPLPAWTWSSTCASPPHRTTMLMFYLVESIRDALRNTISAGLQSRGADLNLESIQQTHEALLQTITAGDPKPPCTRHGTSFDEAITPQSMDRIPC
jgi:hypothetical protein